MDTSGKDYKVFISDESDPKKIRDDIIKQFKKLSMDSRQEITERDLPKVEDITDTWTELVRERTGSAEYDTEEEIRKYSNLRRLYAPSREPVFFFPSETLTADADTSGQNINYLAGTQALAYQSRDEFAGHVTTLGFLATLHFNGTEKYDADKMLDIAIGIPNELLKWVTEEQLEMFTNEVLEASHDFAHNHQLFTPPEDTPEAMMDYQVLLQLSEKLNMYVPNNEGIAIQERKEVQEKYFERNPDLKEMVIGEVSAYLDNIEQHRQQKTLEEPDRAEFNQSAADAMSILYLSHLRPGINLSDIADIKEEWKEAVEAGTRQPYKEVEEIGLIPWGTGLAKPEEIAVIHAAALKQTIEDAKTWAPEEIPTYKGETAAGAWLYGIKFNAADADSILMEFSEPFIGHYKEKERGTLDIMADMAKVFGAQPGRVTDILNNVLPAYTGDKKPHELDTSDGIWGAIKSFASHPVRAVQLMAELSRDFAVEKMEIKGGILKDLQKAAKRDDIPNKELFEKAVDYTTSLFEALHTHRRRDIDVSGQRLEAIYGYDQVLGGLTALLDEMPAGTIKNQRAIRKQVEELHNVIDDYAKEFEASNAKLMNTALENMQERIAELDDAPEQEPGEPKPSSVVIAEAEKRIIARGEYVRALSRG